MLKRLRARQEWQFATVLPRADAWLAALWWVLLVARGLLPALFAIAMGRLVGAVQAQESLAMPLASVCVVFVLLQVLAPLHQAVGANLGFRTAAWHRAHGGPHRGDGRHPRGGDRHARGVVGGGRTVRRAVWHPSGGL